MKFVFLCHSLNIGGLETYILRFSRWLKKNHPCHSIHLVCKSGQFGPYEYEFLNASVKLHSIPIGYVSPWQFCKLYRFLKSNHFDALCDFGGDFGAIPVACASLIDLPRRMVFYRNARNAYVSKRYKLLYQSFLNRIARNYSTHILSNSHEAFTYYHQNHHVKNDPRFHVIPNGITAGPQLSLAAKATKRKSLRILPAQKIVLHVGSGRWEKNHINMFRIAKQSQDNNNNIIFYFAGPDVKENYGEMAKSMELRNVRFLGVRHDVFDLLQIADIFLFPSLSEGQPNALIEAIISGLPFVASNIASIREVLPEDWGERWLFSPDEAEQGYILLKEHLRNDFRQSVQFMQLVEWSQSYYNEDKRFGEFLSYLSS
jgi:glycosyltransferase involved in cell wall biosynthesis